MKRSILVDRFVSRVSPSRILRRTLLIMLGAAICTFGIHNIHDVVGITEGGIIGLVLFADYWFGIPPSVVTPVLDGISYLVAIRILGGGFFGWSLVASVSSAFSYRLWESLPYLFPDLSANPLLASVVGALFVGVGAGLVIRQGGSSGGDDALALSISKVSGWRLSHAYLFTDLSVLALSLTYIPLGEIAYSLVTVMISSPLIDLVKDISWDHVEEFTEYLRERAEGVRS